MYLQQLNLSFFKNIREADLLFSEKINCFTGDNGAGKTNLLDAIYYLSFCKSYFNLIDSQNITHEEPYFAVHGTYLRNGERRDKISCTLKRNERKDFSINGKDYERLSDHIGHIPLVMISPYDRDLINEGSETRRRLIDSVISQFDRIYLENLIKYNKTLQQRNALLKKFAETGRFEPSLLEIYDQQMIPLASDIFLKRKVFLERLIPIFRHYFAFISQGKEEVNITYDSDLQQMEMGEVFSANLHNDRNSRFTTGGIHKDDLYFTINGYPVKKYGSQGQQKSFIVALKLAQFDYVKSIKEFKPILLLDDIFDKLDGLRVEQLINLVGEDTFGQVFITDTQRERIAHIFNEVSINHKIFKVVAGQVSEEKL